MAFKTCIAGALAFGMLANAASVFTVTVGIDETDGQPGLGFDPSSIFPQPGDTITFTYSLPEYIKNPKAAQHSATQSTFDSPCSPKSGGFDTGVQSTGSANAKTGNSYNLIVNDTNPLWFYSSANSDCKSGMVLSVNPQLTGQTAAAFKEKATGGAGPSGDTSDAGESSTAAGGSSSTAASSGATTTGSGTSSSASATNGTSSAPSSTSTGAAQVLGGPSLMGGIMAGVAALLAL